VFCNNNLNFDSFEIFDSLEKKILTVKKRKIGHGHPEPVKQGIKKN
jgi:hypothetical protein